MQRGAAGHCSVFSASVCWDWEKSVEELGADANALKFWREERGQECQMAWK